MSPVHDHYQKVGLVPFQHRLAMLQLAGDGPLLLVLPAPLIGGANT